MAMESFSPVLTRYRMKSHIVLLRTVLHEMGDWCCTSTDLDFKTIQARFKDEGLSFLTITLPQFAKDLEKGLEQGEVDSSLFLSFRKKGRLPVFLQGFTSQIFERSAGTLLPDPNITAIWSIRQICNLFGKLEVPCSDARNLAAIRKYVETEQEVKIADASLDPDLRSEFQRASAIIWGNVFSNCDREIAEGNVVPKHGPGATADRIKGNLKYNQSKWTQRLESVFPHGEFLFPNWRHFDADRVDILAPGQELPVRVVTVPKTLKTPRIIAIEPTCMQYMQQGIWQLLRTNIERDDILSELVGFEHQIPNREMAKLGSSNGTLATLDLSEASDRVSNQLVRDMSRYWYWFSSALDATRSRKADVPGHGVIRLAKFASMGSALCFPVEAIVFTTIIFMAISKECGVPLSQEFLSEFKGKVRVYGDDIIVPVEYVQCVIRNLEDFGLQVNSDKSFWIGKFRESCGKDYYDGVDVSYVKCRRIFPTSRKHVQEIESLVSLRNQLYYAGLWKTCEFLDSYIRRLIPFPVVLPDSPALGRHSFLGFETQRECPYLQRPLVRAFVITPKLPESKLEDYGALLKCFLKAGDKSIDVVFDEPSVDKEHLERAGRPYAVNTKLGWVSPR